MATQPTSNDTSNYLINDNAGGTNAIKEFQSIVEKKDKSTKEYGLKIAKNIQSEMNSQYFLSRNARFIRNRNIANGKHDMAAFRKQMDMEGDENYTDVWFKAIMIISTIISRLVGRWMQNGEKIVVSAVDPISKKQKKDDYDEAEFIMNHGDMLAQLQDATGLPQVKQNQFIPKNKDELDMWKDEEQKLEEEIKYEKAENSILKANGWFDTIKDKVLTDSAEVGLIGAEVTTQRDGMLKVEYLQSENIYYSKSIYPDLRDRTWEAYKIHMKIIDIREEHPQPEDVMFQIAQKSSQYSSNTYPSFVDSWWTDSERPYDDWGVDVIRYRIKTSDSDIHQMSVTGNGSLIMRKNEDIDFKKKVKNATYLKDDEYNIYQGLFVLNSEILLDWGIYDNMVRPQDPKESGDCEFPMSIFMYKQYQMRNLAVPEKIEEPVEQMILTRLKIQQLIAALRPSGIMVDIAQSNELELSPGQKYGTLKLQKIYNQTGNWYYDSFNEDGSGANPNPVRELPNIGGLQQLQGLIATYNYHYQVVREQVGINENAEGQTPKARVTNDNFQASVEFSYNATDYMYGAYLSLMEDVAKKIGCLLHKSVSFGGKYYKDILHPSDVEDRVFESAVEMRETKDDVQYLDSLVNMMVQSDPMFQYYCDPMLVRKLAKEDFKQANKYFRNCQEKALQGKDAQAEKNTEMNTQGQVQAAKAASQGQIEADNNKAEIDKAVQQQKSLGDQKVAFATMFTQLYTSGQAIPDVLKPLESTFIQNFLIPLVAQNEEQKQAIIANMQAQQQQFNQMQQPQQQMQQPQSQALPQGGEGNGVVQ